MPALPTSDMSTKMHVEKSTKTKISAWVSEETLRARPPSLSWGVWIDRLARKGGDRGQERVNEAEYATLRMMIWSALSLDQISKSLRQDIGPQAGLSRSEVVAHSAAMLAEIGEVRRRLEAFTGDPTGEWMNVLPESQVQEDVTGDPPTDTSAPNSNLS